MYRIQSQTIVRDIPSIVFKDMVVKDLLVQFAKEMQTQECFTISETPVLNHDGVDQVVIKIEGLVMPQREFETILQILKLMDNNYALQIYKLLTNSMT